MIVPPQPWADDKDFLDAAKKLAIRYRASILFTTHPRKGSRGATLLDDVAGGTAWTRFSHTVLWIHPEKDGTEFTVSSPFGRMVVEGNRIVQVGKCRNGRGEGIRLAFHFKRDTLNLECLGAIVGDDS